jgi:hypothetical protein
MNPLPESLQPLAHSITEGAEKSCAKIETCARAHPTSTVLIAAGLGVLAFLVVRHLTPPPPRNGALRLLEDIQHRLSNLADEGVSAVSDLHLDRRLDHRLAAPRRMLSKLFA